MITFSQPVECLCGRETFQVLDVNCDVVLRFIWLGIDRYYGGTAHDFDQKLFYGPHITLTVDGMLDLIARLADQEEQLYPYVLERSGGVVHERVELTRHMSARRLAAALGCSEQQVRDHFGLVVKVT